VDEAGVWVQGPASRHISSQVLSAYCLPRCIAVLIAKHATKNSSVWLLQIALHRYQLGSLQSVKVGHWLCLPQDDCRFQILRFCLGHVLLAGLTFILSVAQLPVPASHQASGQQDAVNSFREAEAAATQTCPEAAQRASAPDFRTPQQLLQQVWRTACEAALRWTRLHLACIWRSSSASPPRSCPRPGSG
jgi:hypothetical protein